MKINSNITALALAALSVTATARAADKEEKTTLKDIPEAVQKAFAEHAGKGTIEKVEKEEGKDGKVVYEAEIKLEGDKSMEVAVTAGGKLIKTEVPGKLADLPEAVQKSFEKIAEGGKVDEVEVVTLADGTMQYEADITKKDGKEVEALVAADGKVIKEEAEEKDDDKDDKKEEKGDKK